MRTIGLDREALALARPAQKEHRDALASLPSRGPRLPGKSGRLLSVVAGHSAGPIEYSRRDFNFVVGHIRAGFDLFNRYHDVSQLRDEIDDVVVLIPFGRADGLEGSIDRIVDRMLHDISAKVPHAVTSALNDVLAAARAELEARVRAGDIIIR